jgi:uncharacterized protein YjbI with pentapeptide repeats
VSDCKAISKDGLDKILENHKLWLANNSNGQKADLSGADLRGANLCAEIFEENAGNADE